MVEPQFVKYAIMPLAAFVTLPFLIVGLVSAALGFGYAFVSSDFGLVFFTSLALLYLLWGYHKKLTKK